ncbi:site-specific integrase [Morganella morganii subsp. morganii]|uniref:Integrase n=1 Tax=Salmonella enterica subsp. enterica serovar Chester TaxID=149386 RepID=A0A5U8SUI9_SALET|nr:tyrosine-type recombinase/integrase [Morganella morganii]EBR9859326.1 integrase [Salmonella enterica subsp. enterica serovar Chester]ELA8471751.1 site-specific integrase [Morganella morganii]MBA5854255.1 tyrosine-type recombinase/integrase [Morganella morganii]MBT0445558.1 site-specific integrase [Morganella morganii subsp. morganii]MBT0449153.1 site-specific integrase [Morganella morganii subsp. morganii]
MSESTLKQPGFPEIVQQFFTEYLVRQRALSPQTVACYRDALKIFFEFSASQLHRQPVDMKLVDITPGLILKFLDYLESERQNSVRSRNLRLTALRTFLRFAGRRDITALHTVERALGVPMKRFDQPLLGHLTRPEILAILAHPGDQWVSQRDHLLFTLIYNTGARVSEVINIRVVDIVLDGTASVHLNGKGRRKRTIPLWKSTAGIIRTWLRTNPDMRGNAALLPARSGQPMSRANVTQRLTLAVNRAAAIQPSLKNKRVSPHILRHTTAMHLLQSGVSFNLIALWLGHESVNTTHRYVEANLQMKEEVLSRLEAPDTSFKRFRASDDLLNFLKAL